MFVCTTLAKYALNSLTHGLDCSSGDEGPGSPSRPISRWLFWEVGGFFSVGFLACVLSSQPQGPVPQKMEVHVERGEAAVPLPGTLMLKF